MARIWVVFLIPVLAVTLSLPRALAAQDCLTCFKTPPSSAVFQSTHQSPLLMVASLIVPGTGQLLGGRNRGVVYLVAEAVFLAWHLQSVDAGQRARRGYRSLAFTIARGPFQPVIRDTVFEYFEQMTKFVTSGPFDLDPGPDLAPPLDEASFNGSVWGLARRTFFVDPENPPPPSSERYQAALSFYRARAVGPNFRWSWESDLFAMQGFTDAIRRSDDAFKRSSLALAVVFANHLASAIDAHITQRLSTRNRQVRLRTNVMFDPKAVGTTRVGSGLWISF